MSHVLFARTLTSREQERLREHPARQTRILLGPPYLSGLMGENGIVYRRPKHGMERMQ